MMEPKTNRISSKEWRHCSRASVDDFELLVANEEWKVLDNLADKVRFFVRDQDGVEEPLEFLALYDWLVAHIAKHQQLPQSCVDLVNGKQT